MKLRCSNFLMVHFTFNYRHSLHSSSSDDMEDLGASATSTTFPSFHASFLYLMIQSDEVEEIWRQHVNKVISESSVTSTINTSRIFPRLYRVNSL